ncbi:MAG: CmpA/NrtA family ABC transporter substrate-binding protein [Verrucomicrobiales bacterium]|nr:CmpA/NrtA family ABC transporter substrate-binding protein [Verrucomicrobiales bacterium]
MNKKTHTIKNQTTQRKLRVGFVPLTDCAPLVMAHELGLFRKFGLNVALSRELGWATIRDKVIHGELEAAHAVAGMPVAATLGLGSISCDCLTALVLNLHGNAITLSNELWKSGVRDGKTLHAEITRSRREKTFTFGVVSPHSSHNFLLRDWLAAAGIHPDRDVRVVVVPPPQMVANLKAGNLDGFCVGEPWNSMAVQSRVGWCVAVSAELAPGHPEKVLMVRRDFAGKHDEQHLALVAALLEACEFCDAPGNREQIIATLALPAYVNVPAAALRRGFSTEFDFGHGEVRHVQNFSVFHRHNANEPSGDKAAWVLQRLRASGLCPDPAVLNAELGHRAFRTDIFDRAVCLRNSTTTIDYEKQTQSENELVLA